MILNRPTFQAYLWLIACLICHSYGFETGRANVSEINETSHTGNATFGVGDAVPSLQATSNASKLKNIRIKSEAILPKIAASSGVIIPRSWGTGRDGDKLINNNTNTNKLVAFPKMYDKVCNKTYVSRTIHREWEHNHICKSWTPFSYFGNFTEEDFKIYPPKHLVFSNRRWELDHYNEFMEIPKDVCIFSTKGWFNHRGALIDCKSHYPLMMKRDRKDLSLDISSSDLEVYSKRGRAREVTTGHLYSVIIPYNEAFSHAFSTGVSMLVYMLPLLARESDAKLLVPGHGPFRSLCLSLGIPEEKLVTPEGAEVLLYAQKATYILRRPPFNIVQAHWPNRALSGMRNRTVEWLASQKHVDLSRPRNQVIYLWRDGERGVQDQSVLVEKIRRSLRPEYELVVEGRTKISYQSEETSDAWLKTADKFVRAAAVIGPHGGAFGNIYLCASDTVVIEFNVPWTPQTANGDSSMNKVRDLFYSYARGAGFTSYWNVWPKKRYTDPNTQFYRGREMSVDHEEVVEILRRAGIAHRAPVASSIVVPTSSLPLTDAIGNQPIPSTTASNKLPLHL